MSKRTEQLPRLDSNRSLVNDVYDRIHNAIVTGVFLPGQKLRQVSLAEDLGVSPRTVREALARILAEGFAEHVANKGFRVISFPLSELEEIYQMRGLLEGWAMELAAKQITPPELDRMRKVLPASAATEAPASVLETHSANRTFHMTAIEASGKKHLIRLLRQLWQLMFTHYWVEDDIARFTEDGLRELEQHEQLLVALEKHDARQAKKIAADHAQAALTVLKRDWKNRRQPADHSTTKPTRTGGGLKTSILWRCRTGFSSAP